MSLWKKLLSLIAARRAARHERIVLESLSEHRLRDLGLSDAVVSAARQHLGGDLPQVSTIRGAARFPRRRRSDAIPNLH